MWKTKNRRPSSICTYNIRYSKLPDGSKDGSWMRHKFRPRPKPKRNRPGMHFILLGTIYRRKLHVMCPRHFARINRRSRRAVGGEPEWALAKLDDGSTGRYDWGLCKGSTIFISPDIGQMPSEYIVYVIQHEYLHWVMERDLGLAASSQLDLMHRHPLRCLRGHTLESYLTNLARPQKL